MGMELLTAIATTSPKSGGTASNTDQNAQGFSALLQKAKPADPLAAAIFNVKTSSDVAAAPEGAINELLDSTIPDEMFMTALPAQVEHHNLPAHQLNNETSQEGHSPQASIAHSVSSTNVAEKDPLASSILASIHMGKSMERPGPASMEASLDSQAMRTVLENASKMINEGSVAASASPTRESVTLEIAYPKVDPSAEYARLRAGEDLSVREAKQGESALRAEIPAIIGQASPPQGSTALSPQGLSAQPPHSVMLQVPVTSQEWGKALSQQLINFSMRGAQEVELHLNPVELGPLSISLKVNELQANAHFVSHSSLVRQALEQAIPQLRETLSEQGIQLGEASVGQQHRQQFAEQGQSGKTVNVSDTRTLPEAEAETDSQTVSYILPGNSQISTYA